MQGRKIHVSELQRATRKYERGDWAGIRAVSSPGHAGCGKAYQEGGSISFISGGAEGILDAGGWHTGGTTVALKASKLIYIVSASLALEMSVSQQMEKSEA